MSSTDLTLYELAGADPELRFSPHCWKVRMALAHKGLDAKRVPWRFTEQEEITFSGQGLVPVLVHDAKIINDSWRIALHLEEHFPQAPSLFGHEDAIPLAGFVNSWADSALLPAISRIILLDVYRHVHEKDRHYFRSSREKRFGMSLEEVAADRPNHLADLRSKLAPLRQILKKQDFISGSVPAYADYCVFGMFMWARCTSPITLLEETDSVFSWRERLLDMFNGLARSAPSIQS